MHQFLAGVHSLAAADPVTLAKEYLGARFGAHHDRHEAGARQRWAEVVRAFGRYVWDREFLRACEAHFVGPPAPVRQPTCERCGSPELTRDAVADWDSAAQQWSLSGLYDCHNCQACEREGDDIAIWVMVPPLDGSTTFDHAV